MMKRNRDGSKVHRTDEGVIEAVSHAATPEARKAAAQLFLRLIEKTE